MPLTYPSRFEKALDPATWDQVKVNPEKPIAKDLNGFLLFRIAFYEDSEYRDTVLWMYFREDLEDWTKETWAPGDKDIIREFRDFLRRNGVFVPIDGRSIAANIQKVLDDNEEHQWTPQEVQQQINSYRRLDSRWNPASTLFLPPIPLSPLSPLPPPIPTPLPPGSREQLQREQTVLPAGGIPKLLTDLAKLYSDQENKFGGELYDILGSKLRVFYDLCQKVGIQPDQYQSAFSIMLKGRASHFYYDRLVGKGYDFNRMCHDHV